VSVRIGLNGARRHRFALFNGLELVRGGRIVVEATTPWPFASVNSAASRLQKTPQQEFGAVSHAWHSKA